MGRRLKLKILIPAIVVGLLAVFTVVGFLSGDGGRQAPIQLDRAAGTLGMQETHRRIEPSGQRRCRAVLKKRHPGGEGPAIIRLAGVIAVDFVGAELTAGAALEIRADRVGLDAAVAFHGNGTNSLRDRDARRRNRRADGTDKGTAEDHAAKGQSPNKPHTTSHS